MKAVVIGAHLLREDVEPVAEPMPVADVFLSTMPVADDQPLGDRELLLRVAAIRARLLEKATFIAVRYGFAVTSEAEARAKCGALAGRWKQLLEEHRNEVEMTLKVAAASPKPRPKREDFTSGAAYLKALHEATQSADIDASFRNEVERTLIPLTNQHRWIHRDNTSLELAMLVERGRDLSTAAAALKSTRVPFLLSGPWPLEVFAE